jgi:O-methyltransferase involved in polyketide biosynthesis
MMCAPAALFADALPHLATCRAPQGMFTLGAVDEGAARLAANESGVARVTGNSAGSGAEACGFDPGKPNAARIYDYLLGGKDNYVADREAAERLLRVLPDASQVARANRAFLAAAIRYVAGHGIRQYVDIGAGLPTSPNVHDCARETVPSARVVYVDNDPVVLAHARALLATDDLVTVISADAREYPAILSTLESGAFIDLSEPVCVLFVSMLHFVANDEADAIVAAFRERMAPGSHLVLSAGTGNSRSIPQRDHIQAAYGSDTVLTGRPAAEIASYFGDFDLVPPGLVPVTEWPVQVPDPPQPPLLRQWPLSPAAAGMLAGIGRKPR